MDMQQEPRSLGEVFKQLVAQSPHQAKLKEAAIICAWKQLMPAIVIQRTERIFVQKNQLFLKVNSAPLRQELQAAKSNLLLRLEEAVPGSKLQDVILL